MNFFKNIKRSGIAALILAFLLSGCKPSTPVNPPDDFHISDSSAYSEDSTSVSVSNIESPPDESSSEPVSTSSDPENPPDSSDSVSDPNSSSEPGGNSSSSLESTSSSSSKESSSSTTQSSSSSQTQSTSSQKPEPPAQVVIPDFAVPTSPGTKLAAGANGVVDFSNASLGYVSAKYTGSSAKCKFRVAANSETPYDFDLSANGSTEYFPLPFGNGTYTVTLFEQVEGTRYATVIRQSFEVEMQDPRSPYMYSNRYVLYSKDSKCVYKAAELCAGKTDNISKIAAIFQYVTENISYDYDLQKTVKKNYCPDPDRTLASGKGICFDYASLMAAMLRSQSIPTRLVIGDASPDIRHAWNEIYTEQTGWITPELLLKNNGYNIVDATFYASAKNKKEISAYISNQSNYAAEFYY